MERKLLGKRIKEVRRDRGLTAERLAELCHIDATYLRQIEGGSKTPSLPVFVDLCNTLRTSPSYLLQDLLDQNELTELGTLSKLWSQAEPSQIELAAVVLKAILEHSRPEH